MFKDIAQSAKNFFTSNKGIAITAATFVGIYSLKSWFGGGVCKVDRDLSGKVIVITGANTGIGKTTIEAIAHKNCTIIFGARDKLKSLRTIDEIKTKVKNADITYFELDLSNLQSIKEFAAKVIEKSNKIDILINNAAVMALPHKQVTAEGFQMQMGVNHLGHFYLTHLLWDKIKNVQDFRVINVSSEAHEDFSWPKKNFTFDLRDLKFQGKPYTGTNAYTRSKIANILFTRQIQRRITESGRQGTAVSLHPGVIRTELLRHVGLTKTILLKVVFMPFYYLIFKTPWEGAQTTLYTVLESQENLQKGGYYSDCKIRQSSQFTRDMENAALLWQVSQQALGIQFNV